MLGSQLTSKNLYLTWLQLWDSHSPFSVSVITKTAYRTRENTFVCWCIVKDFIKDVDEQPDEEIHSLISEGSQAQELLSP